MSAPEEMTEEVVEQIAEAIPEFVQSLNKIRIQFGLLGVAIGVAAGATTAFYIAYRRAEVKYRQISDDEIEVMREHYHMKAKAAEGDAQKGAIKTIVNREGYADKSSASPPMAVQPPAGVIESEDERAGESDDSAMAEDAVEGPEGVKPQKARNIFRDREPPPVEHEWDYHAERRKRSPDAPYVIHVDEKDEFDTYQHVTLTYYTEDDVLCDDRDVAIDPERDRERLVGEKNLDRFGHGSNDPSIVYIRNDELEIMYEVVRSPNSYAEEVHGFSHTGYDRGNVERMRARERDAPEE